MNVSSVSLKSMSVDKLSKLRDQVDGLISAKITEERRTVQDRLSKLDRLVTSGIRVKGAGGRRWGAVPPKYHNPENPAETWAGRGLKPRWLVAAMKSGKKLEYFSIAASAKKGRGRAKKA